MLTLDYANCLADRIGPHGVDADHLDPHGDEAAGMASMAKKLATTRGKGWERWRDLHRDPMRSEHVGAIRGYVEKNRGRFENLVVLGIGGSALGNIALQSSLNTSTYNLEASGKRRGPRMFVVDNVDPAYFGGVLNYILSVDPKLEKTLFNVVSKSGETAETAAQFMCIRDLLKKHGRKGSEHVVAVTDPAKGTMRQICNAEGYFTLPVPDGVGGRFSVLSPVGLFSAAMCGIDIEGLLDGAGAMDPICSREDFTQNPAAMLAYLLVELGETKGKVNHVLMPYCNQMYLLADWFRQLWAESLGKKSSLTGETVYAGFTPIKALGTTDQHSQVQLYREGPNDKVIGFVELAQDGWSSMPGGVGASDVTIPTGLNVDAIRYLEGKSMAALLHAEKRATEYACVESQRPNFTITFPKLDAHHVGQFIYLWEMVTAYAGLLLDIDAYDQPAVELGKQATFGLMGRPGYEKHLKAVEGTLARTKFVIGA
ncbi:MAG TPA: glucose-6-phosphate isomerase [Phycisphaerales bacterium]|nr:glucose-6-phosphate isomerase [Phycisphaerales bacterium]